MLESQLNAYIHNQISFVKIDVKLQLQTSNRPIFPAWYKYRHR
jgi:hypothetical protein